MVLAPFFKGYFYTVIYLLMFPKYRTILNHMIPSA